MAEAAISAALRELVRERAGGRCEYCQISEQVSGIRCQIDHIVPRSRGGPMTMDNLCMACIACNAHKHARTHALDQETGGQIVLFHPRQQSWRDHFAWSAVGSVIIALTPTGRVTVSALEMNDPLIVAARSLWVAYGAHPPREG